MLTVSEYRDAALAKISISLADYVEKKSGLGRTFAANLDTFTEYQLLPRVLQNINQVDLTTLVLGKRMAAPIIIAPTAWHKMFCEHGEKDTAFAAHSFGIPYIVSSFSTCDFEEMGNDLSHVWYQLLIYKNKTLMRQYIEKAEQAGCSGIVLTIDAPLGCSMCKTSSSKTPTLEFPIKQLPLFPKDPAMPFSNLDDYYKQYVNSAAGWNDIKEVMSYTSLPIILKGILHPLDIQQAIDIGIKAVVISNHGGRQLDDAISTLDALALLRDDMKKHIDIYLDGGVRTGADVFKALALGAKAVLIGRAALYGLIVDGQKGLLSVLSIMSDELRECMHMAGVATTNNINKNFLYSKSKATNEFFSY
ncbi:MAG: alpha-hydroxy acid oxidase [Tatlockia sp.]|jgi:isopentenyl diphosphate isomerase/L-lactate dehydrogenase-like FMN-dependent dehydrogenase